MLSRICQNCGFELVDEARFCPSCGTEVPPQVCQYCGSPITRDSQFCPTCGKDTTGQTCQSCGGLIPTGSKFCPTCGKENETTAKQDQGAALLAQREAEAREKARQEAEAARIKLEQEREATLKAQEAALLAQREAEARERARQEAEVARIKEATKKNEEPAKKATIRRSTLGLKIGIGFFAVAVIAVLFWIGLPMIQKGSSDNNLIDIPTTPTTPTTPTSPTSPTTPTVPTTPTTPTASNSTSNQTLSEVLGKANSIVSIKYDAQVTRSGSPTLDRKIWVEKGKTRIEATEQGQLVILLVDGVSQTAYRYLPAQNTAVKVPFPPPQKNVLQEARGIPNFNPEVVGSETIDGKICVVIESVVNGVPTKAFIWQEYGIPIRIEITADTGMTVIQYSNIEFIDIQDSMFELPTGIKIVQ